MTQTTKETQRITCLAIRKALSSEQQAEASVRVCARIQAMSIYQQACHIAIYHAIHGEIDLNKLRQNAHPKATYYSPVINADHTLSFIPILHNTTLRKNRYGIKEPDGSTDDARHPNDLDLILLPVVAFDKHGTRLGMGGGYYDRTLTNVTPTRLIGVAYDFQYQSFIQPDDWDVPLSAIITPNHTYRSIL
jgi:5-formyltetrahydrofolate cyclo-ligase